MCKSEKTQLNDRVAIGGFCVQRTDADKVQQIELKICFVWKATEYVIQSIQTSLEILCREPIKINKLRHDYDFIGGTLNYVTYVMSQEVKIIFSKDLTGSILTKFIDNINICNI